jgi:hypothetical protein
MCACFSARRTVGMPEARAPETRRLPSNRTFWQIRIRVPFRALVVPSSPRRSTVMPNSPPGFAKTSFVASRWRLIGSPERVLAQVAMDERVRKQLADRFGGILGRVLAVAVLAEDDPGPGVATNPRHRVVEHRRDRAVEAARVRRSGSRRVGRSRAYMGLDDEVREELLGVEP